MPIPSATILRFTHWPYSIAICRWPRLQLENHFHTKDRKAECAPPCSEDQISKAPANYRWFTQHQRKGQYLSFWTLSWSFIYFLFYCFTLNSVLVLYIYIFIVLLWTLANIVTLNDYYPTSIFLIWLSLSVSFLFPFLLSDHKATQAIRDYYQSMRRATVQNASAHWDKLYADTIRPKKLLENFRTVYRAYSPHKEEEAFVVCPWIPGPYRHFRHHSGRHYGGGLSPDLTNKRPYSVHWVSQWVLVHRSRKKIKVKSKISTERLCLCNPPDVYRK